MLVIKLRGGAPGDVTLRLDGEAVPRDQLGAERRVDPGPHSVEARSGDARDVEEITLEEGERTAVELSLPERAAPPLKPAPVAAPPADPGRFQRTLGGVALALGAAGVAVWGVTGALALAENVSLSDQGCGGGRCPYGVDQDTYRGLRATSMIGFWAGLAGAGAGTLLLLTAPRAPAAPTTGATVGVWAGPTSLGIRGSF